MGTTHTSYKNIPAVGTLLNMPRAKKLAEQFGKHLVTWCTRHVISTIREDVDNNHDRGIPDTEEIFNRITSLAESIQKPSLTQVINATGIILHTNLGRAVLGDEVLKDMEPIIRGYSNLEYDLHAARRGHRDTHIQNLLAYLCNSEGAIVVNNNAAALYLILTHFARDREVIISRGELIEIGGSFRIPDIMASSGASMIEVGTTNKTRFEDYEKAISDKTALIFKAHQSNFSMTGFTQEASLEELSKLARKHDIHFVYDLGSGIIKKPGGIPLKEEPDVTSSYASGADLITFSGDKLLGGPQAGIITGKMKLLDQLSKNPLMRVLRVGKLTYAALISVCRLYLDEKVLVAHNSSFKTMQTSPAVLEKRALALSDLLHEKNIPHSIIPSKGKSGGGSLPQLDLASFAVMLKGFSKARIEQTYKEMQRGTIPVVPILREGKLLFDILCIADRDIPRLAEAIESALTNSSQT